MCIRDSHTVLAGQHDYNLILYLQIFKYVDGILGVLCIRKETGYVVLESDLGGKKGDVYKRQELHPTSI